MFSVLRNKIRYLFQKNLYHKPTKSRIRTLESTNQRVALKLAKVKKNNNEKEQELRTHMALVTSQEELRAKRSYSMSSKKF